MIEYIMYISACTLSGLYYIETSFPFPLTYFEVYAMFLLSKKFTNEWRQKNLSTMLAAHQRNNTD